MTAAGNAVKPGNDVTAAAQWLADQTKLKDGLCRQLRDHFGLNDDQIVEAVQLAGSYRLCRRAFG